MKYSKSDLNHLQKEELVEKFLKLQNHVDYLNARLQKPGKYIHVMTLIKVVMVDL